MPMSPRLLHRREVLAGAALVTLSATTGARAASPHLSPLELVATFNNPRQVTGVGVSSTGRIFVNFPRWEEDVAISVAEVGQNGVLTPYPDLAWNAFRDGDPHSAPTGQSFVCVQSVTVDAQNRLWVLDAAAPGLTFEVPGGPKLVCIDLASNRVSRIYPIGTDIAPQGSYLNDIRFTADGKRAVITNSGAPGCLIVLDVTTGAMRRVLSGHPSTQFDPLVTITVKGKPLTMLDGQPAHFSADGIMLDGHDQYAYWQATTGQTVYRAPLSALFDAALSPADLAGQVQTVTRSFVTDGYLFSRRSGMLVTAAEDFAVKRLERDGSFTTLTQDPRLLWPDSMAEGPDGAIYVTASHIPDMKAWQGPGVTQTQLFRFHPI